ncbi:GntR family transcriptional regulator [Candidatus Poriferisodalis sp.]|uniref:GntR family transcriptional regulator n=1 Tax=Candidatus Poriferisodalis sp. TaxID=3101277 RepID=UPI003B010778
MASTTATRGEEVYQRVRSDIVAGEFRPGSKLRFAMLTGRYESSASVIREGLARLVEQGLVLSEPQQGYRVAPVSIRDLKDLTLARCAVESQTLRLSLEHGDLAWESSLVAAIHALERTPVGSKPSPGDPWPVVHRRFHEILLEGCPSQRLINTALGLRDAAELYRRWSVPADDNGNRDLNQEHRAIADAAINRDTESACKLLEEHLNLTARLLVERGLQEGFLEDSELIESG